jgi:hypothetical protein
MVVWPVSYAPVKWDRPHEPGSRMPGGVCRRVKNLGAKIQAPRLEPGDANASITRSGTRAPALECAPTAHAVANGEEHLRINGS